LHPSTNTHTPSVTQTQAEVVLCLRGGDAQLAELFEALARQSHRAWSLRVIVDSKHDSAWQPATEAVQNLTSSGVATWQSAVVEELEDRHPVTGTLKCASMRQALSKLQPETAVVAGVDGDAAIGSDWLITLIAEVRQPGVGAVSGNRWYEPSCFAASDFTRAYWGTASVVVMQALCVPWGGSMAVRREVIETSDWVGSMQTAFGEDTSLTAALFKGGWKFSWVPSIVSVEKETPGSLIPCSRWVARQLLAAYIHHPTFWLTIVPFTVFGGVFPTVNLCLAAVSWARGDKSEAAAFMMAFGFYELGTHVMATSARAIIMHWVVKPQGIKLHDHATLRWMVGGLVFVYATQIQGALGCIWAVLTTRIEWRGVHYARRGSQVWIVGRDAEVICCKDGEEAVCCKPLEAAVNSSSRKAAPLSSSSSSSSSLPPLTREAAAVTKQFLWDAYAPALDLGGWRSSISQAMRLAYKKAC